MLVKKFKSFLIKEMDSLKKEIGEIQTPIKGKIGKVLVTILGTMLFLEKRVFAAPSTGFKELDGPAWKILKVFQAIVFWMALFYTIKALLMVIVKGQGTAKDVIMGVMVCVGAYVIPWIFGMIPGLFSF